ncbi:hypothetical protein M3Y96_01243900 [Aphelenchoides besseyi]|nr:hypothetical protein M3Y96_01243900 [Aphelenchoides besseyi]
MIFITSLLLLFAIFIFVVLAKSLSRFKTEFSWYQRTTTRPSNRVCRTVVIQNQIPQAHSSNTYQQCHPNRRQSPLREGPFPLQICRNQPIQQSTLPRCQSVPTHLMDANNHVTTSFAYVPSRTFVPMTEPYGHQPLYYHPSMIQYQEPPPPYFPNSFQSTYIESIVPSAPPMNEAKE